MLKADILAIGATFFSAGLTMHKNAEVLTVEDSFSFASDFVPCMKQCKALKGSIKTAHGQRLYDIITERGMANVNGDLHIFPLAELCSELFGESRVMLGTSVTKIVRDGDSYAVSLFNGSGRFEIVADEIVDTTSLGAFCSSEGLKLGETSCVKKSFCATLVKINENAQSIAGYNDGSVNVKAGGFPDEYILSLSLPCGCGYADARKKLADIWRTISSEGNPFFGWNLAAVASNFLYEYESAESSVRHKANGLFAPSCAFSDPIAAFEGGVKCFSHI